MIVFKTLFFNYILLPLMALVLLGVMAWVQKANKIKDNKKLIIYLLLAGLLLGLPGFGGFAGNTFSPYPYLFAQIYYFLLGILHVNLLGAYFKNEGGKKWLAILFGGLLTLLCMVLGFYLFTILFNCTSSFEGYAWMSGTCIFAFPVPLVFYYCYMQFIAIPFDIRKVWMYEKGKEAVRFDGEDYTKLMVLNIDFTKQNMGTERVTVKAKSPGETLLGEWFHRFIEDYNIKYPQNPIEVTADGEQEPYGWIFYTKPSFFHRRRYLDFERSIAKNKITEKEYIVCKRVTQLEEDKVVTMAKESL